MVYLLQIFIIILSFFVSKDGNRKTNKVYPDAINDYHFTDENSISDLESSELTGNFKNNYYYTGIFQEQELVL